MRVELKQKNGTAWEGVPANNLVGDSIVNFIARSPNTIVACLYDGDTAIAYISNAQEYVDMYKERGLSLSAKELQDLIGTDVMPSLLAQVFPDSTVMEIVVEQA